MVVIKMVRDSCLANMGQKQGQAGQFIFYTFDNENKLLRPHIHILILMSINFMAIFYLWWLIILIIRRQPMQLV